eukprot:TRINITY_DN4773_c0_g1_i1.p1 TRINITY_DN4773_c0_g1~~TRINITY_DN4773_c0_g1_i1.p1  ORF type:complete len:406 (-),score=86.15 TRINITY_DN4773_c0_g1_i1:17-1198(-)
MDHNELVSSFLAITNVEDPEIARNFLESNDWNLEKCVNLYLEDNTIITKASQKEVVRDPILFSDKPEVLLDPLPQRKRKRERDPNLFTVFNVIRPHEDFNELEKDTQTETPKDGVDHSLKKQKTLINLFRPPTDILFRGDLDAARHEATSKKLWLLLNLQSISEFDSQRLNRDTWPDKSLRNVITENFLFIQVLTDESDGQYYRTYYPTQNVPHVAVLDPQTGGRVKHWDGFIAASTLQTNLEEFLKTKGTFSNPIPQTRQPKIESSKLAQDQKMIKPSLIDVEAKIEETKATRTDQESGGKVEEVKKEGEKEVGDCVLQIRLMDGQVAKHTFYGSDLISQVIGFVVGKYCEAGQQIQLAATFPRRILQLDSSIKEAGLFPRGVVIVEPAKSK